MPNPWDLGSARLLAKLGFPALATTSSGFAWSLGRPDNRVTLDEALAHLRAIAGGGRAPGQRRLRGRLRRRAGGGRRQRDARDGDRHRRALDRGLHRRPAHPLFDFELAVERVRAARAAIDASGTGVVLTGRSEGFIVGRPDLDETIRRLTAYAEAGADCLYAPGLRTRDDIAAVVRRGGAEAGQRAGRRATSPPWPSSPTLGVRRISVGGALARAAWGGFLEAAREIAERGRSQAGGRVPFAEIDCAFARRAPDAART